MHKKTFINGVPSVYIGKVEIGPAATPTPTPIPPSITGECVFPRILTGTLTPRLDTGKTFYRVRCIIDKWGSHIAH